MILSEKIKNSKKQIKLSQKDNITYLLFKTIMELDTKKDNHFLQSIPVTIVSANESFFKETIACLINFDQKYLLKTKTLIKRNNQKIEIEDILNLTELKFTLGDLIAYSLKYSSFESIYKTISDITELDFFKNIKQIEKTINDDNELEISFGEKITIDKNRIFKNMNEIYEMRNVICHDVLSTQFKLDLNPEKMREYLIDSYLFQNIIDEQLITIWSSKNTLPVESILELKKIELSKLYDKLEKSLFTDDQKFHLQKNKEDFEKFVKTDSENMGNNFNQYKTEDIIFPELLIEYKIRLINQRIENIESDIHNMS